MRYVMRNAKSSESSKLWTQLALPSGSMSVGVSVYPHPPRKLFPRGGVGLIAERPLGSPCAVHPDVSPESWLSSLEWVHLFRKQNPSKKNEPFVLFFLLLSWRKGDATWKSHPSRLIAHRLLGVFWAQKVWVAPGTKSIRSDLQSVKNTRWI